MPALTSAPSLLPLYAKAAVTGPLHRGDALPESEYSLADQSIDAAHLAAYQRVCGFRSPASCRRRTCTYSRSRCRWR